MGLKQRLLSRLYAAFPALTERWVARHPVAAETDVPWTPLRKPLAECTVAVVTTGGVHLASQPPFDMSDPDGDPGFRVLPADAPDGELVITHDYYDARDARRDRNLVYPVERLAQLAAAGRVGGVASRHVSLMGHVGGRHVETLRRSTAPAVAELLRGLPADVALLVPA
jgi:D-proline reductase (dithiol) PrdB